MRKEQIIFFLVIIFIIAFAALKQGISSNPDSEDGTYYYRHDSEKLPIAKCRVIDGKPEFQKITYFYAVDNETVVGTCYEGRHDAYCEANSPVMIDSIHMWNDSSSVWYYCDTSNRK